MKWWLSVLYLMTSCHRPIIDFPSYFPQENRMAFDTISMEQIKLGERLFFDPRLSLNNKISCATCHKPELAFTDGEKISKGFEGNFSLHNSSTLFNIGFHPTLMFDNRSHSLELQPMLPIQDSHEMRETIFHIEEKLKNDRQYQQMSQAAFGDRLSIYNYNRALSAYMKSLISANSTFDLFYKSKDSSVLSPKEKRGMALFFGKGNCSSCHCFPLFTNFQHYNLGLEDSLHGRLGLYRSTHLADDRGRFKTPTLRNIEITSPYFHDGRIQSLDSTLIIHISNQTKDYIPPKLSPDEQKDIVVFLKTLTDKRFKK